MSRANVVRDYGGITADARRAERRRRLLDACRRVWGERGLDGVTVRGVLAEAGLTPRYFYEQFADRDALIVAVADELRDEIFAALLARGIAESGGPADKLRAGLTAFFEIVAADPHIHRIIASDPSGAVGLAEQRAASLEVMTNLLIEYGSPLFDEPPPEPELRRATLFMVGGVNQLIVEWLRDMQESPAELGAECTRLCMSALEASRRRTPVRHGGD